MSSGQSRAGNSLKKKAKKVEIDSDVNDKGSAGTVDNLINTVLNDFLFVISLGFIQISCTPSNDTITQEISSGLNPKMIGGQVAGIERAGFVVAIFDRENFICGGALITLQTVLTAATCTYRYNATELTGTIGKLNRMEGQRILFREIRIHRYFHHDIRGHDIAFLMLTEPIRDNNGIFAIRIGINKIQRNSHVPVSLYGWKQITNSQSVDGISSDILQVMPMVLLSSDLCNNEFFIRPDQLAECESCAMASGCGILETGGDMGGPLVHYIRGMEPVLLGLMSRVNFRTCGNHVISIFTKVSRYHPWLRYHRVEGVHLATLHV